MKHKNSLSVIIATALLPCMTISAYANSSWHWFAGNPLPILPWLVVITLLVEIFAIRYINGITNLLRPVIVVTVANVFSFLCPYIFIGLVPEVFMEDLSFFERINNFADKWPLYAVGIAFLILTLIVEIPVVYNSLKKSVQNKKRLLISGFAVNCGTTLMAALVERTLYRGSW